MDLFRHVTCLLRFKSGKNIGKRKSGAFNSKTDRTSHLSSPPPPPPTKTLEISEKNIKANYKMKLVCILMARIAKLSPSKYL